MTSAELRDILATSEFQQGLLDLSSYLASIMQERPIVYLLAKCLWKRGIKFELEAKRCDLVVNETRLEFKFNYNKMVDLLSEELTTWDKLEEMWAAVQAGQISKSWGVMPRIYKDVCDKKPDIFVWIICSRDLGKVADDEMKRICVSREQCKYNTKRPYSSDGNDLTVADTFLNKLQVVRPFSLLKQDIETKGDFLSTYHFRICEFH